MTSAAVPRAIAPSAKLALDPSLTHLVASASARTTSRYIQRNSWPEVFTPPAPPTPTSPPAPTINPGDLAPVVTPPALAAPGGGSAPGGGGSWTPYTPPPIPPIASAPASSGGGAGSDSAPVLVPDAPALPIASPPVVDYTPLPKGAVAPGAPVDGQVPVPDTGITLLLLGLPLVVLTALRRRFGQW